MLCEHQRGRVQWVMSVDCHRSRICGWDRRVEGDFRSPLERNQTIVATFPSDSMRSTGVAADARWFENTNHRRPMKVCLTYAHDVANEAYTSKGELHYLLPPHKSYQRFLGLTISPTPSKYVQDCIYSDSLCLCQVRLVPSFRESIRQTGLYRQQAHANPVLAAIFASPANSTVC